MKLQAKFTSRRAAAATVRKLLADLNGEVDVAVYADSVRVVYQDVQVGWREYAWAICLEEAKVYPGKVVRVEGVVSPDWVEVYRGREGAKRFRGYSFRRGG